jgi:hypothetical protein
MGPGQGLSFPEKAMGSCGSFQLLLALPFKKRILGQGEEQWDYSASRSGVGLGGSMMTTGLPRGWFRGRARGFISQSQPLQEETRAKTRKPVRPGEAFTKGRLWKGSPHMKCTWRGPGKSSKCRSKPGERKPVIWRPDRA